MAVNIQSMLVVVVMVIMVVDHLHFHDIRIEATYLSLLKVCPAGEWMHQSTVCVRMTRNQTKASLATAGVTSGETKGDVGGR